MDNVWKYFQDLGCTGTGEDKTADFMTVDKAQMANWMSSKNVIGTMAPHGIVLHYTAGSNVEGAVSTMGQRGSFVHLIIDKNGDVRKLLPFNTRVASGSGDGNSFAVGIEIVGMDAADLNTRSTVGDPQYDAVIKTVQWLMSTYSIPNKRGNPTLLAAHQGIFGHQQVQGKTPMSGCRTRKIDPGSKYLNAVWATLQSEVVEPSCKSLD